MYRIPNTTVVARMVSIDNTDPTDFEIVFRVPRTQLEKIRAVSGALGREIAVMFREPENGDGWSSQGGP